MVILHDWGGLLVVCDQSLDECLGIVVAALDEGFASDVISHGLLWWVEDLVVRAARGWVDQASGDTRYKEFIVDLHLNGVIEWALSRIRKHRVQALSLGDCAWESIEDESAVK